MAPIPNANFGKEPSVTGHFADGDFETACAILQRYDAIDRSVAEAVRYAQAADRALWRIAAQNSANPALLDALSEAANFAAHRHS